MDDAAEEGAAAVADASGVPSFCFNSTADATAHDDWASMQTIIFWVEGIGLGVCGTLGIVGNILTCVVLAKITLNNVFNQLIVMLCIFDTMFNGICVVEYSLKKAFGLILYSTPVYVSLWPQVIYPLQNITNSASLCITMAIAVERYLAVCHPFFVHQEQSVGSSSGSSFKKRTWKYLLPALAFAVTINIPKFMEFRNFTRSDNSTFIEPTELRLNKTYTLYYVHWTRAFLLAFLPFTLLAVLNGRIIHQIWKAEKISARTMQRDQSNATSKRENKLARILVLLVFSFLLCNLGKLVLNVFDIQSLASIRQCSDLNLSFRSPFWVVSLISINHLLIVTNASTNLVLFSVIGTQFRATLLAILHLRPSPQRMSNLRNGSPTLANRAFRNHNEHPEITTIINSTMV